MADDTGQRFRDGIRHVKLSSVPRETQWELARHLDSHCHLANWKSLAERFGLPTLNIMSIEDRVCYTPEKSCTLLLFDECLNPKKITLDQLVQALALIKNLACIHVLEKAFLKGDLKTSNKNETNAMKQTCSLPAVVLGKANANDESQAKKIFITYSEDSRKMAKHIYRWLRLQGCIVSLDILEGRLLQENKIAWYDKRFREANHIIILVSPQYAEDIAARGASEELSPITLYLHNRMQAEYLNNYCTNKRFIPIVLPGAMKNQGPEWLMYNTIAYYWPRHHRNIFHRIHELLTPTSARLQYTPIIRISRT